MQFSNQLSGLFANAIVNGGNALCDMFHQSNPQEAAVELASRLDCTSEKGEDILRCLSTQTQQEIVLKQSAMFVSLINFVFFNNLYWINRFNLEKLVYIMHSFSFSNSSHSQDGSLQL